MVCSKWLQATPHWKNYKALPMPEIPIQHVRSFTQQLATLVCAGVPLLQSLDTVAKGARFKPMQDTIIQLRQHIAQGMSLQQGLRQAQVFDPFFCQLVAAGEISGNLDGMLRRLATHLDRQHKMRQKVKMALIYPVAVLLIGMSVAAVILIWVVPVFQSIFASFGAELPAATRLVLNLSDGLLQQGPKLLLLLLLTVWGIRSAYRSSPAWQLRMAVVGLDVPLTGSLIRASNDAIWTRCMATLLQSGVPLLDALEVTAGACPSRVFALFSLSVRHAVSQGSSLSAAMRDAHLRLPQTRQKQSVFDVLLVQMVNVGEESGTLATLLTQAADEHEQALERQIDGMTQLIEPLMVVLLGGMVGGLVVALYLPVFQLGQVL
jgi:type IV pilus assembly protein PilC